MVAQLRTVSKKAFERAVTRLREENADSHLTISFTGLAAKLWEYATEAEVEVRKKK